MSRLEFALPDVDCYVPDGLELEAALARTSHLAIGAHQDDLEFMAYHGIVECFGRADRWFAGVCVTNGAGSARSGPYSDCSDEDMQRIRVREQRKAAGVGEYGAMLQLMAPSALAKDAGDARVVEDLRRILEVARPDHVYLHNPCDKHDTHVACCVRAIEALRQLPAELRPRAVYGCEIWRDLDWLPDARKVVLACDAHPNLAAALNGVFDSQIVGGKRYDLAIQGRRAAHATFFESHEVDAHTALSFAMDLMPLLEQPGLSVADFALSLVDELKADVQARIERMLG